MGKNENGVGEKAKTFKERAGGERSGERRGSGAQRAGPAGGGPGGGRVRYVPPPRDPAWPAERRGRRAGGGRGESPWLSPPGPGPPRPPRAARVAASRRRGASLRAGSSAPRSQGHEPKPPRGAGSARGASPEVALAPQVPFPTR